MSSARHRCSCAGINLRQAEKFHLIYGRLCTVSCFGSLHWRRLHWVFIGNFGERVDESRYTHDSHRLADSCLLNPTDQATRLQLTSELSTNPGASRCKQSDC